MALTAGTKLDPHEIQSPLGATRAADGARGTRSTIHYGGHEFCSRAL